ncbi:hypothetical protein M9Y10_035252 [Tritrichomonas musculus]|uniref:Leucine Rich Repeat family protein n=1 Tax=Tritrichomonas musculus TaxID=1915356 RepID=A0ABR2KI08_9EUKA
MSKLSSRKTAQKIIPKKDAINPYVADFHQACKSIGFQDQEIIQNISLMIPKYDNQLRFVNIVLSQLLCRAILKFIQKYTKLQKIEFYSCIIQDITFTQTLSNEFSKNSANYLSFDFTPISREDIIPLLMAQTLDILSLRGVQTLTSYDYRTHEPRTFPPSLNSFCNVLSTSSIKVLNLFDCHIGDIGAIAISNVLMFNSSIQCLSLVKNRIGDQGAIALSKALSDYELNDNESAVVDMLITEENRSKISDEGSNLTKKKKGQKTVQKKPLQVPKGKKSQSSKSQLNLLNFDPSASISPVITENWKSCKINSNHQRYIPGNRVLKTLLLDDNEIKPCGISALKKMLSINDSLINFSVLRNNGNDNCILQNLTRVRGAS